MFPRLVYEILPMIYSTVGFATVVRMDNMLGRASGALLLSAAVAIYTLRRVYRSL